MLKENGQMKLSLSPYQGLYDIVVPKEHLLRKIKENVDFSFVNPLLRKQYCENFGRPAKEPEMMFKLLERIGTEILESKNDSLREQCRIGKSKGKEW